MKRKLATFMLGCFMVMCIAVLLNIKSTRAAISNTPVQNVDEISKSYTDSDTLLNYTYAGETWTIQTYVENGSDSPLKTIFQGNQTVDDPITAIIPKQLFAARGEYLHFGNEYGFYVHTRGVNQAGDSATIKPYQYSNLVTVMVFDVTKTINLSNMTIKTVVSPLFCYDYAYIVPQYYYGSQIFYYWQPYYSNWEYGEIVQYKSKGFQANGKSDIVIALPDGRYYNDYDGEHFQERWQINERYAVKELAMAYTLSNTNELNLGGSGYDPNLDQGCFFNALVVSQRGSTLQSMPDSSIAIIFKYVFSQMSNIVGAGTEVLEFIDDVISAGSPDNYSGTKEYFGAKENTYQTQFFANGAAEQIEQFSQLLKTTGSSFVNEATTMNPLTLKPMLTEDKDYFSLEAQYNKRSQWATSLDIAIDIELVFRATSSVMSLQSIDLPTAHLGDTVYLYD